MVDGQWAVGEALVFQVMLLALSVADLALVKAVPFILQGSSLRLLLEACAPATPGQVLVGRSPPFTILYWSLTCQGYNARLSSPVPPLFSLDNAVLAQTVCSTGDRRRLLPQVAIQRIISRRGKLAEAIAERASS